MITRLATLALVSLVLLHQVFAGVFGGGTVLCVGGAGGFAVQPVGMTCCATHAAGTAAVADPCCPDDATANACSAVSTTTCAGCTDYVLTTRPTLPPAAVASLAASSSQPVVIALVVWPEVFAVRTINDRWVSDRAPPPLAFLRTIVLRC